MLRGTTGTPWTRKHVKHEAEQALLHLDALLDAEEAEVKQRQRSLLEDQSEKGLEQAGILLVGAKLEKESAALFGRVKLTLVEDPGRKGHLDRFAVRPGSVVRIREEGEDGQLHLGRNGVIVRRTARQLVVVFDEMPATLDGGGVDLIRVDDDVSLRRMREGVAAARAVSGRKVELLETLLGIRPPTPSAFGNFDAKDALLHPDQITAAQHGVFAPDVGLVHGPPGTGKTRVVVEIIRQAVARGERVLALCASNAAVDHVALGVLEADDKIALARAGHPARIHPALEAHTLSGLTYHHELRKLARNLLDQAFQLLRNARRRSDRGKDAWRREREARAEAGGLFADARRLERQAVDEVMRKTQVLVGTLTGFARELPDNSEFQLAIVDEASQALTPAVLIALPYVERIVLAGDHKQLPPTVLSPKAAREGLATTAFEALIAADDAENISQMLTVQHRMHQDLMAFPSQRFYDDKLVAHPTVAAHSLRDLAGFAPAESSDVAHALAESVALPDRVLDVIDTAGAGFDEQGAEGSDSRENPGEAKVCRLVAESLLAQGLSLDDMGIITPYSGQVAHLRQELERWVDEGLEIDSVDGFQGREKEVIIFSAVRSNPHAVVGFLADERRLNVAITRAKRKLVVVLDSATVGTHPAWGALVEQAIAAGHYRSCFEIEGAVS